jgi:hypothetical protein
MAFMFCVMFPVLLYAEYIGSNSIIVAGVVAGISSGVSVVLFPDPEHLKRINKDNRDE